MKAIIVFSYGGEPLEFEVTMDTASRIDVEARRHEEVPNANQRRAMSVEFDDVSGAHHKYRSRGYVGMTVEPDE